ncbi:MAG: hypothetical protein IH586_07365 [Anaerolineaceae bacterium]|nr:hypothetical protein [Anaerolineaceae bacterium]
MRSGSALEVPASAPVEVARRAGWAAPEMAQAARVGPLAPEEARSGSVHCEARWYRGGFPFRPRWMKGFFYLE